MLEASSEDVFPASMFKCVTVRKSLIIMHTLRQRLFRMGSERDPKVFREHGHRLGVAAVANLHANIIAHGDEGPSPTARSNAHHFPSEAATFQVRSPWCWRVVSASRSVTSKRQFR